MKDSPFWRSGGTEIPKMDGKEKRDGYVDLPVLSTFCVWNVALLPIELNEPEHRRLLNCAALVLVRAPLDP